MFSGPFEKNSNPSLHNPCWGPNFRSTYHGVNARLALCLNSILNVKALVGAFSVIVKTDCETDRSSAALAIVHTAHNRYLYHT